MAKGRPDFHFSNPLFYEIYYKGFEATSSHYRCACGTVGVGRHTIGDGNVGVTNPNLGTHITHQEFDLVNNPTRSSRYMERSLQIAKLLLYRVSVRH
jgi:ABC-type uncharacterized transport system ATPase subunit